MTQYTKAVGTKFHEDGTLRRFPGNTIICKTVGIEPLTTELVWAQNQLKQMSCSHKFSFLPPASFHMTVFELLCDQVRDPQHWSAILRQDAPLTETDEVLRKAVSQVEAPKKVTMEVDTPTLGLGLLLRLKPADAENESLLRNYRDRLAEATGIRFPNHDTYRFHISFAYNLIPLTDAEKAEFATVSEEIMARLRQTVRTFQLGTPEFVLFHDMGDFQSQLDRNY